MNRIVGAIVVCAAMVAVLPAHAQTPYPSKPVRLLIPFPPGGPTDSAVRVFLPALSQALGQPLSIVNMAGSHGALAPTALLKEPPDGHTLLVGNSSPLVAVPILRKDAPYDPVRDFAPVALMGWTPLASLYTGAAIAVSSTTIIAKAFSEQKVRGRFTEIVIGILIIEDLIAILLLALLTPAAAGSAQATSPLLAIVRQIGRAHV